MLLFCSLQTWRETEMCDQTSVHPLMPFESPPLTDMEMLLAEHIIQTVVPPFCCRQCRRVHPLPHGPLSVCPGWLNTCFLKSTNMLTNQQSQVGRTAAELFRVIGRPQSLFTGLIFLHLSSRRRCSKKGMKE